MYSIEDSPQYKFLEERQRKIAKAEAIKAKRQELETAARKDIAEDLRYFEREWEEEN